MKLKQQVCSLEFAKQFEELGVKQESIFSTKPYEIGTDGEYTQEEAELMFGRWVVSYSNPIGSILRGADTEADARAKMLVYLLENKLITV